MSLTESIVEDAPPSNGSGSWAASARLHVRSLPWVISAVLRLAHLPPVDSVRRRHTPFKIVTIRAPGGVRDKIWVMLKRILNKYVYPPDLQEEAVRTVLQEAELLCADIN